MKLLWMIVVMALGPAVAGRAESVVFAYPADSTKARLLLEAKVSEGYLDAVAARYEATIAVRSGERVKIGAVLVNDSLAQTWSVGEWCSRAALDGVVTRVVEELQEQGHYLARARVESLRRTERGVEVGITAQPGPVVRAARLLVEGLTRSNEAQVRRALPVIDAQLVHDRMLAQVRSQARAIDYLSLVEPLEVLLRPGYTEADVVVRFREQQQVRLFGGGGYAPDDDAGLVWNLDLALANLFGAGRKVTVHSSRPDQRRSALTVDYSQPVFWLGVDRARLAVATRDYRDDFYEFGLSAVYTTRLTSGFDIALAPGWRRVEPSGSEAGFSAYSLGLAVTRDRIEEPTNPTGGYRIASELTYVNRRYSRDSLAADGGRGSFNETRARLALECYIGITGGLIGKAGVTYLGLETGQALPPLSELYLVGGPGSLRGYRTEQFVARQAALVTVEPRYRFEAGYLFAFYDAAYLNRPALEAMQVRAVELFRSSLGFGLGLVWPSQQITLSFGWGEDSAIDQPRLAVTFVSDL